MIYLVDLEYSPTRYTAQWKTHFPKMLKENGLDVTVISGGDEQHEVSTGAFINFASTNIYKAKQLIKIASLFENNEVKPGDKFLFADAWNPAIINTRYMIDLHDMADDVEIHSIWHAGSYDPNDFLGRKANKDWSYNFEASLYEACDVNYFATQFHLEMFMHRLGMSVYTQSKAVISGFPMEYIKGACYRQEKEDIIVFPHRVSEEKNPDLFKQIAEFLPQYKFVICQEEGMTKKQYYDALSRAKVVWSANQQETLGIGVMEGVMSGCIPIVPDRLSYKEMYFNEHRYRSGRNNVKDFVKDIVYAVATYDQEKGKLKEYDKVFDKFFSGSKMYTTLKQSNI